MNSFERKDTLIQQECSKKGLRGRVNAHCIDCGYDPLDKGTWRQQIHRCAITNCPLFDVRPLSRGEI